MSKMHQFFRPAFEHDAANVDADHQKAQDETGFWGKAGAGCLLMAASTGRALLSLRSEDVNEPGTWGTWGGAIDPKEDPAIAAKRELIEETALKQDVELIPLLVFQDGDFKFYNFLAIVPEEFEPVLDWENKSSKWVYINQIPNNRHFGLVALLGDPASALVIHRYATQAKHKV